MELLDKMGGLDTIAKNLRTDLIQGLEFNLSKLEHRRQYYGTNNLPEIASVSFLQFVWEALQDRTIVILIFAAVIELGIGIYKYRFAADSDDTALIEGVAVVLAGTPF